MTSLVSVLDLTKRYKHQRAVNQISLDIKKGEICGLVGENGAGKTTLLRMLAGLIQPSSGRIEARHGNRLGALIESPTLQPNLSALANLRYMALQLHLKRSDADLQQILELVGLGTVDSQKKAKDFSLGMRQRLAIALAILDEPAFLILDEPINGLDPVGIKEMRQIILRLRDSYHMTILISSHILSELELVVDRYIIMHKGRIIKELSKDALHQELQGRLYLQTADNPAAQALLESKGVACEMENDYLIFPIDTEPMLLVRPLFEHSIDLVEVFKQKQSFEAYYLNLITQGE